VKDFTSTGIAIQPGAGTLTLTISNTYSLNNAANGILIMPTANTAFVNYSIDQTTANGNGDDGFDFDASQANQPSFNSVSGQLTRSQASMNAIGIYGTGNGALVSVVDCYGTNNSNIGAQATNGSLFHVANTKLVNNHLGIGLNSGAGILTYGNNIFDSVEGSLGSGSFQ
jgi:hypothetical protein